MALKPHLWAYDDAPVENPTAALILLALADEAADDGTGACPYIPKLMKRARCSERSVQNHLRDLFRARLINNGDPRIAMRRYKKSAGQAPRCWDLNLSATWDARPQARTEDEMRADYSRMIGIRPPRTGATADDAEPDVEPEGEEGDPGQEGEGGVQDLHPSTDQGKHQIGEVQNLHPSDSTGVQPAAPDRCSPLHPTGAAGCTLPAVDLSTPEKTPPLSDVYSLPGEASLSQGGDLSTTEKQLLTDSLDQAAEARKADAGWSKSDIVAAMSAQLEAGHPAGKVAAAIRAAALDPETNYPGRIGYLLKVATPKASAPAAAAPAWAEGPVKYLAPGTPMCRTHRGEPEHGCNKCAGEAKGAQVDAESVLAAPVLDRAAALELARRNATKSTTKPVQLGRGPLAAPRDAARPNGLDLLRAAVVELGVDELVGA